MSQHTCLPSTLTGTYGNYFSKFTGTRTEIKGITVWGVWPILAPHNIHQVWAIRGEWHHPLAISLRGKGRGHQQGIKGDGETGTTGFLGAPVRHRGTARCPSAHQCPLWGQLSLRLLKVATICPQEGLLQGDHRSACGANEDSGHGHRVSKQACTSDTSAAPVASPGWWHAKDPHSQPPSHQLTDACIYA